MVVDQIYTGCLAHGAYYLQSGNEVAIIDPLREVEPYIDMANEKGGKIKYIFETHFHADFVSGHLTLAEKTGADIVFGPLATPSFNAIVAKDGEEFKLGNSTIKILHTPGHTMESTTFLLIDEEGNKKAIFTGDTLFLGDVGRPDLAQKGDITQDVLAGYLFDSLREKIMTLPDDVTVYPGHGAGSACGKNMMDITVDSLGNQKKVNYALRADMTKEEFVKEVTDGLEMPPAYFPQNVMMNKRGYLSIDDVLSKGLTALSPKEFKNVVSTEGATILDTRHQTEFAYAHLPNSVFIGLDGSFAPWVGDIIKDVNTKLVLIVDEGREEEAVTRLSRVGFDNVLGYLKGGVAAWQDQEYPIKKITSISADEFAERINEGKIIDVRKHGEHLSEHVMGAENITLSELKDNFDKFNKDDLYFVHCAGGYRSMIASSLLEAQGVNLLDIAGGFKAIKEANVKVSDYVCPSTL